MTSLRPLLAESSLEASAPSRVDAGGTWDIKALALPFPGVTPTTVNVAINLRTRVRLLPYKEGSIKISSRGFPKEDIFTAERVDLSSPFGLFSAAVSYFGFHGLEARIHSGSPVKSALGGSSTALVALIGALNKASVLLGGRKMSALEIIQLAYALEDAVSGGNCGLQDHCAAAYGGVHQWNWRYGRARGAPFKRRLLLGKKGQGEFSRHLIVAYSGRTHTSHRTNRKWIRDFLSGKTRAGWIKVNEIVHRLAEAVELGDWAQASKMLAEETALRRELTPECLTSVTSRMVEQAEQAGCGARFAGAGAGGSVWALGKAGDIQKIKGLWKETLEPIRGARILDCAVDSSGVL